MGPMAQVNPKKMQALAKEKAPPFGKGKKMGGKPAEDEDDADEDSGGATDAEKCPECGGEMEDGTCAECGYEAEDVDEHDDDDDGGEGGDEEDKLQDAVQEASDELDAGEHDEQVEGLLANYDADRDGDPPPWVADADLWHKVSDAVGEDSDHDDADAVIATAYKKLGGQFKGKGKKGGSTDGEDGGGKGSQPFPRMGKGKKGGLPPKGGDGQ